MQAYFDTVLMGIDDQVIFYDPGYGFITIDRIVAGILKITVGNIPTAAGYTELIFPADIEGFPGR